MATEQAVAELTLRDVLHQIDRRLILIEADQRALDAKFETRFTALDDKFDRRATHLEDTLRRELNNRFYWLIGIFFAGWVSLIGTILFKP